MSEGRGQRRMASLPVCSLPDLVWSYLSSWPWQSEELGSELRILEMHAGSHTSSDLSLGLSLRKG